MFDDKEDLNCSLEPKMEQVDSDKDGLLVHGGSRGVSFGEGSSEDGLSSYSRRKRRKMGDSGGMMKSEFNDKPNPADGSAFDRYVHRLKFDAFSNGPSECSLRKCSILALPQMHQSLNGQGGGVPNGLVTNSEGLHTPVIEEALGNAERSDNKTHNSAQELSHILSSGLLKQSEGPTNTELCTRVLSDILKSEIYSELRGLLRKNFGDANVNQAMDFDGIRSKLKNGAYENSPMLYLKDIQQVWTKLLQVGNEMVTLSKSLSDISRAYYEQYVRKPRTAEACGCQGCGQKADVKNCLVCDSCEDIYHLSCTELVGTPIPPKSWYCPSCVSNGIGSPHDSCTVCEKLKTSASIPPVNGIPTNNQSQDAPNGLDEHLHNGASDESQSSYICFICKSEVKMDDNFRTCAHLLCAHKHYHYKCLTGRELGVYGPYWYCPSCLCRRCLVDKDDDQIVLCDGCDQAYHIYCASPQLNSIPKGKWFCGKCDMEVKRIKAMRMKYESMQKVKIEEESEKKEHKASVDELEGLDILVSAAKTLSHEDTSCNIT